MQQDVCPRRKVPQRREIGGIGTKDDHTGRALKPQRVAVMDWRMLDPQSGDPDACVLIDRAVAELLPTHQVGQRRHADLTHPAGDVKGLPGEIVFHQIVQPRRAEDLHVFHHAGDPRVVDEAAQLHVVVGVVMGDENPLDVSRVEPGLPHLPGDSKPRIDQVGMALDHQNVGGWPGGVRPDLRAAFGTEQDQSVVRLAHPRPCPRPRGCRRWRGSWR